MFTVNQRFGHPSFFVSDIKGGKAGPPALSPFVQRGGVETSFTLAVDTGI
jgi:hypothetical protein